MRVDQVSGFEWGALALFVASTVAGWFLLPSEIAFSKAVDGHVDYTFPRWLLLAMLGTGVAVCAYAADYIGDIMHFTVAVGCSGYLLILMLMGNDNLQLRSIISVGWFVLCVLFAATLA